MFTAQEIIRKQRDGESLPDDELTWFIQGITSGSVTESQAAAFAMAVYLRGMGGGEIVTLTQALRDSGEKLTWDLPGPVLDKHSTGGVGDLVSLVLAPLLAACGAYVPMISGRGLGHTGGTLDKLESIPGYNTNADVKLFKKTVKESGCAIIGQTKTLAPADGKLYAIRDITSTVESTPLIVASILSKKLASGLDTLILDVKAGNGAFMSSFGDARKLAIKLTDVARACGLKSSALLTDMSQPLAYSAGNALEVNETIAFLKNENQNPRLKEVIIGLATEALTQGGLAETAKIAKAKINDALESGKAAEHFSKMVTALGGPSDLLENPDKHLTKAKIIKPLGAYQAGHIHSISTRHIGLIVNFLGGGRTTTTDKINHAVGLTDIVSIGDKVEKGQPILTIHADTQEAWDIAAEKIQTCFGIDNSPTNPADPVLDTISPFSK